MIAGLSKAIIFYLAPILSLTSILLAFFAFLAPVLLFHGQIALLVVSPSSSLSDPESKTGNIDGPTLFLGPLGSSCISNSSCSLLTRCIKALALALITTEMLPALFPLYLRNTVRAFNRAPHYMLNPPQTYLRCRATRLIF